MSPIDLTTPMGLTLALLPEIVLTVAALVVLLIVSWRHETAEDSRLAGWGSLAGVIAAASALAWLWGNGAQAMGLPQMVALDSFRYASIAVILIVTALTILLSLGYLEREGLWAPEYYPLVLLAAVGMMFMAGAEDLVVLFLGLEVMSVAVYVLAGFNRGSPFSAEAALKYFLIGAFASGFLLYGIALIYGATGVTNLQLIGAQLGSGSLSLMGGLGLGLLLIGFAFKVAAVPFHMWAPDVYDGAPTPVTGFMATGVKAAAFVALLRTLLEAFPLEAPIWRPAIAALAVVTMIVGNVIALRQRSIKRMLAYSSVAHAGYLLVAVWSGSDLGAAALLLYLLAYGLTTLAAFGLLAALGRGGEREVSLDTLAGLGHTRPWVAAALSVCMLSLLGFPGTFGFIGKWYILVSVVVQNQPLLAVVVVVTSVVSAGYYLPVVRAMYMREAPAGTGDAPLGGRIPLAAAGALVIAVALVLALGFVPNQLLVLVRESVSGLASAVGQAATGQ